MSEETPDVPESIPGHSLVWKEAYVYPPDPLIADFLDVYVEQTEPDQYLATVGRYQRGPYKGLWIVTRTRGGLVPDFLTGKVFEGQVMRKNLIRLAIRLHMIDGQEGEEE